MVFIFRFAQNFLNPLALCDFQIQLPVSFFKLGGALFNQRLQVAAVLLQRLLGSFALGNIFGKPLVITDFPLRGANGSTSQVYPAQAAIPPAHLRFNACIVLLIQERNKFRAAFRVGVELLACIGHPAHQFRRRIIAEDPGHRRVGFKKSAFRGCTVHSFNGVFKNPPVFFLCRPERIHQGIPIRRQPLQVHIIEAELGKHPGKLHEKRHFGIHGFSAESWSRFQCRKILFFRKPVFPGLQPEQFLIGGGIIEEELPGNDVGHVPAGHHDRGRNLPHVVLAPVEPVLAFRYAGGQLNITFDAVPAGFGVHPMESPADLSPSRAGQHPALEVDDRQGDAGKLLEAVHQGMNARNIDDGGKLQIVQRSFEAKHFLVW
ncbi:MAG: hypothetical protein A4E69_03315 [Syntrophus sp. PtaB.Bin138]|nr:MAG: hypothetical protein A4E69_03315 [Syntrophus sp. PtaB.Bin138]